MVVLDDATVELITVRAREIRFWRTVLTLLAGLFYGIGWTAARVCGGVWLALAWMFTAVRVGWQEGRKPARVAHGRN